MKSNYNEKVANKIVRYKELAAKNKTVSQAMFERAKSLADQVPMGQPVLVGHHSEKRHRRLLNTVDRAMSKGLESSERADFFERRLKGSVQNKTISSDNPDATKLLEKKIQLLENLRDEYKRVNKICKDKKLTTEKKMFQLVEVFSYSKEDAAKFLTPDYMNRIGIPDYQVKNNTALLSDTKKRLERLRLTQSIPESETKKENCTIKINQTDNRVQISFDTLPDEKIRRELKENGFHWSPVLLLWMRKISNAAIFEANRITDLHEQGKGYKAI